MARALALAKVRKAVQDNGSFGPIFSDTPPPDEPTPGPLPPGHMRLYAYYKPNLDPGLYGIEARQQVTTAAGGLSIYNYQSSPAVTNVANPNAPVEPQIFNVIAPQFSLDPRIVNSHYPPDGDTDEARVLPHIVFNDPHFPWDRPVEIPVRLFAFIPRIEPIPWIALIVFDPDELKINQADADILKIPNFNVTQLPASGAFPMTVGDYITKITCRMNYEKGYEDPSKQDAWNSLKTSTETTNIIFPTAALARDLLYSNVEKFKKMSHVREVNTTGMPDQGLGGQGLFSICVSHRSGQPKSSVPVTQVVHLVSIEYAGYDIMNLGRETPSTRVGLVSLYSWTYLCVPTDPSNFLITMTKIAGSMQMLRPSEKDVIQPISDSVASQNSANLKLAAQHLHDRLNLGYSVGRWRTAVGTETVAFTRGPLVPSSTPWKPSVVDDWPGSSNTGKEYQILDKQLGVMDVSYSSAWQLGKLMAISDTVFSSALLRFRSLVHKWASSDTRMLVNGVSSVPHILKQTLNTIDAIHAATNGNNVPSRNIQPSSDKVAPAPSADPRVMRVFKRATNNAVDVQSAAGERLYSDYTLGAAHNPDWEIIHKWISDKLFLTNIPAHYLITDPSHLPPEALRFFYIDPAWLDCYLDGALSVANHLEPVDDKVRRRIKDVFNVYLRNNIEPAAIKPPVPRYGFILRSSIVRAMPDLQVTVSCRKLVGGTTVATDGSRDPLLRLTKLDDHTILALLDCLPEEIDEIRLKQPPHQQRFIVATTLVPTITYHLRTLYTQGAPEGSGDDGRWPLLPAARHPSAVQMSRWYDASSRCINVTDRTSDMMPSLQFSGSPTNPQAKFANHNPDSTIFALELNDDSHQLVIKPPSQSNPPLSPPPDRQIWVGTDIVDDDDPIPPAQGPSRFHDPPSVIGAHPAAPPSHTVAFNTSPFISTSAPIRPIVQPIRSAQPVSIHQSTVNLSAVPVVANLPVALPAPTPASATIESRYLLNVHPDYRSSASLPHIDPTSNPPLRTYSAHDYIPTSNVYLLNLIFSVQLDPAKMQHLASNGSTFGSLSITIPVTPTSAPPAHNSSTATQPEPLLFISPNSSNPNISMLHNKRLKPLLSKPSSNQLIVQLTPRSAAFQPSRPQSLPLTGVQDASFQLHGCTIAPTVTPQRITVVGPTAATRGVCTVRVVETYLAADGRVRSAESDVNILKMEGADVGN